MNILAVITARREKINALLDDAKMAVTSSENIVDKPPPAASLDEMSQAVVVKSSSLNQTNLGANTKIRELQSKIKALEDNLETAAVARANLENHVSSLRSEVKEVTVRSQENERKITEECRCKDRRIQALEVEVQQFYRDGCAKESDVVNEEVLEEMRLLRTENKTLMNNIVNLTENNSKNLNALKALRKLVEYQSSELVASRKCISQFEAMRDIGSEQISKDRLSNLEVRIESLQSQIQKAASLQDGLRELEGEKETCGRVLLDMVKEARDVLGSRVATVETIDSEALHQNDDSTFPGSNSMSKRQRQSREDSSGLHRSPLTGTVTSSDLEVKASIHLARACCYCEDEAYGLMNRCGNCGSSFHISCGTMNQSGLCAKCSS